MRTIDTIIIHCTATPAGRNVTVADVTEWHRRRGFATIGYHYLIGLDGTIYPGRPIHQTGAHCRGHNARSIGIAYVGGTLADCRTPADTRTPQQRESLRKLVADLRKRFPGAKLCGHRDLAPTGCPGFDVNSCF